MEMKIDTGLMRQIEVMIAPPSSNLSTKKTQTDSHNKGKGQIRGKCDVCGEYGNVICCEKCPTMRHMRCEDPPLDDDVLRLGKWLCQMCKAGSSKIQGKMFLDAVEEVDPLELLIKAAEQQNPYRYVISRRYKSVMSFPGADKISEKISGKKGSANKRSQLCFICSRGSRVGQLLNCDYCSLSYHLDCLDPPLTVPPLVTWMCPNHAEQFLDEYLLQSNSAVERAKLWAVLVNDIDHEALKLEFIRKVSRKNPPFRYKIKKPERLRASIPAAVGQIYQNPIPLIPSLPKSVKMVQTWKVNEVPTNDEIKIWLSGLCAMQSACAWDMCLKGSTDTQTYGKEATNNYENAEKIKEEIIGSEKKLNPATIDSLVAELGTGIDIAVEALAQKMDARFLKVLAVQRLREILSQYEEKNKVPISHVPDSHDIKLKIKEEYPSKDVYAMFDENAFLKNGVICPKKKYVALQDLSGELKNKLEDAEKFEKSQDTTKLIRATLSPVGPLLRNTSIFMRMKTLTIGTSPDSDLCLTTFGKCRFASPNHAKIFYDALTGGYELLNYSPHGTVIDGCVYFLDATQWRVPSAPVVSDHPRVRSLLDKRRGIKRDPIAATNIRVVRKTRRVCDCADRLLDGSGWEGSALLQHCSLLQFGCLQFVFSIVDFETIKVATPEEEGVKDDEQDKWPDSNSNVGE